MNNFSEIIKYRRSIRNFEDRKIPIETLHAILQDTVMAPSASNRQPWKFIIIQNTALIRKISDECRNALLQEIEVDPNSKYKKYADNLQNPNFHAFYNAPCIVLVAGKDDYDYFIQDCSNAATYFMLAATARNLGTCWIAMVNKIDAFSCRKECGITDPDIKVALAIAIGYPKETPAIPNRTPIILNEVL